MKSEGKKSRCSYQKIGEGVREEIIERIIHKGESIKEVAGELRVNISTCKAILKVYQQEGRIGKKKQRNKVINVIETFSFLCLNDSLPDPLPLYHLQETKLSLGRDENYDLILEENAKTKAEQLLEEVAAKKKLNEEQSAASLQNQLIQMQLLQNNFLQFFPLYLADTQQEELYGFEHLRTHSECSSPHPTVKQECI